jgi:5'-3' exonuclease
MELGEAFSRTINKVQAIVSGYDHVAICLDVPPYKRKELFAEYKAHREAPDQQMLDQFARVKERLVADAHLLWGVKGYEADDIIATAVPLALAAGLDVMIASSDKDLLQLVVDADGERPGVRCMSLATGQVFDEKAVAEKFGVPPQMMGDLLALMGDKSDNIPGVEGVGVKTAADLLRQFGSFDDVFSFPEQITKPKLRENVVRDAAATKLGRSLVTLYTDAPIKFTDLFERREPKSLTKKAPGFDEAEDAEFTDADPVGVDAAREKQRSAPTRDPAPDAERIEPRPVAKAKPSAAVRSIVLAKPPEDWALQLEPGSTKDAYTMAVKLNDSRLFTQFPNADAIFAVILRGRSLGLDAVTSLANFHVIKGRPVMHASLIVGLVLKSKKAEYFDLSETTDRQATWVTKRAGSSRETVLSWSIEDALNAGLLVGTPEKCMGVSESGKPSNWDKYRRTMLRWRAATELARAVYPDITTGLYTPDEISDGVYDPQIEQRYEAAQ